MKSVYGPYEVLVRGTPSPAGADTAVEWKQCPCLSDLPQMWLEGSRIFSVRATPMQFQVLEHVKWMFPRYWELMDELGLHHKAFVYGPRSAVEYVSHGASVDFTKWPNGLGVGLLGLYRFLSHDSLNVEKLLLSRDKIGIEGVLAFASLVGAERSWGLGFVATLDINDVFTATPSAGPPPTELSLYGSAGLHKVDRGYAEKKALITWELRGRVMRTRSKRDFIKYMKELLKVVGG